MNAFLAQPPGTKSQATTKPRPKPLQPQILDWSTTSWLKSLIAQAECKKEPQPRLGVGDLGDVLTSEIGESQLQHMPHLSVLQLLQALDSNVFRIVLLLRLWSWKKPKNS